MAVILAVDIDLKHQVILIEDALAFRQGAGHHVPQAGGMGVGIGGPQQQALVAGVAPGGEGIEGELIGSPGLPGIEGDALLGINPGAVAAAGEGAHLVDLSLPLPGEELHVDGVFPAFGVIGNGAGALGEDAGFGAEKVFVVGDQGDDGGLGIVIDEIGGAHRAGGNQPFLKGSDAQGGGLLQGQAFLRKDLAFRGGGVPVRGIPQDCSLRGAGLHGDAVLIKASRGQQGRIPRAAREGGLVVLFAPGGIFQKSVVPAAGGPAVADAAELGGKLQQLYLIPLRIRENQLFPGGGNREGGIQLRPLSGIDAHLPRAPDRQVFAGLQLCALGESPFLRVFSAVAQVPSAEVHYGLSVVIQLHPVPGMAVFKIPVAGHDLVDHHLRGGGAEEEQQREGQKQGTKACRTPCVRNLFSFHLIQLRKAAPHFTK